MTATTVAGQEASYPTDVGREVMVALDAIDLDTNSRDIDPEHVEKLAASIALRGLVVPLNVTPVDGRYRLVAGYHRYAACAKLGLSEVKVTLGQSDGASGDAAAENVLRKQLSPLGEARAVKRMLDDGYTVDGAAEVLGFSRALVTARAKILELPKRAQAMLDDGRLPVGTVDTLQSVQAVGSGLADGVVAAVFAGDVDGQQLVRDPAWTIGHALRHSAPGVFAAYLTAVRASDIEELRLGKKAAGQFAQAEALHRQLDRYAYGPPQIRFGEVHVDQARAAGVLLEFERGAPIITDKALHRELCKQAIAAAVEDLTAALADRKQETATRKGTAGRERTPREQLDVEHRAQVREHARQARATNLDLGTALLNHLASVDPGSIDVARFFAYGVLGPEPSHLHGSKDNTARTLAANGIRLVLDEHRDTVTPTLKSGQPGKTKVRYGEIDDALAWLWKFIDGAKAAGELYGRVLVVFAAEHYASQLVLAASQRRSSALPSSHKDHARKAFTRLTRQVLPASHTQLQRAIEREARDYQRQVAALNRDADGGVAVSDDSIIEED